MKFYVKLSLFIGAFSMLYYWVIESIKRAFE